MKHVPLSNGKFALVDDEDWDLVKDRTWHCRDRETASYAWCNVRRADGRRTTVQMHRLILGLTDPEMRGDHRNHDGLDNRRSNLRVCTPQMNSGNTRGWKTSDPLRQFKGVLPSIRSDSGKVVAKNPWTARIRMNKKNVHLGVFKTAEDAAEAYDRAALSTFGEFAYTNFPREFYL